MDRLSLRLRGKIYTPRENRLASLQGVHGVGLPHIVVKQCFYHSHPILLLVQRCKNIPFERDFFCIFFPFYRDIFLILYLLASTSSNYHHQAMMRFYAISVFISSLLVNFLVTLHESHLNG